MTLRVADVGAAGPDHSVRQTDRAVDIGQQEEREPLGVTEGAVLLGGVERCADDGAIPIGERFGIVTQCLALQRSTRCGGLRVPPQEKPAAAVIQQRHRGPVLIGKGEQRRRGSRGQHGCNVARPRCWRRSRGPDRPLLSGLRVSDCR